MEMPANNPLSALAGIVPMPRRRRTASKRRGLTQAAPAFTLIEVILALVILGGALAIFGEVMQIANSNAVDARAETQAQLLASSIMDEIMAGVEDDSPVSRQPVDVEDDTRWIYSVETGTSGVQGVYPLVVTVEQDLEPQFNPVKFRLVRWMPTVAETDENVDEAQADQRDAADQQREDVASGSRSGQSGGSGSGGGP
jgi:prepilin-type N-terminal cleavage/methylation domain-containing protein